MEYNSTNKYKIKNSHVEQSHTAVVEQNIKDGYDIDEISVQIKDNSTRESIRNYFSALLERCNLTSADAVNMADLDKDFGAQIIKGQRRTRRDNYIKLGIAMRLDYHEIQSMLKFVQRGQIYALRQRDAAIMFCIHRRYTLMETQLMLDAYDFKPLGDGEFHTDEEFPLKNKTSYIDTGKVEQIVKSASSFDDVLEKTADKLIDGSIEQYFDNLLDSRNIQRKHLFSVCGINPNTGYQLLRGLRRRKNRDAYLKMSIIIGLDIDETQRMLKLLDIGAVYPLVERDFAIYYGISKRYDLEQIQDLLAERGFLPL